jgi:hypothetical protein
VAHEPKKQSTGSKAKNAPSHDKGVRRVKAVTNDRKRNQEGWQPRGKAAGNQGGKGKQPKQQRQQEAEIDEGLEW